MHVPLRQALYINRRLAEDQAEGRMEGSIGKKQLHPMTREALQNGFVDEMIARSGTNLRVLSDEERRQSLEATLAAQTVPGDVWLFAYGSLIWRSEEHTSELQSRQYL